MNKSLSPAAQIDLRQAIVEAGGNEVFCLGRIGEQQVVAIEILARGNRSAVPAILPACRPGDVVIHNHPGGNLEPSAADLEVAGQLGTLGVGFFIVDNEVERLYRVVEPSPRPAPRLLDPARIGELLGPAGGVSRALPAFEDRPEQLRMAFTVGHAFNEEKIVLIEAATGTGKSLAYLVPAILWALANRERVVVSTRTINLQEQLVRKDLPFLQQASGLDFRFELVKGRSNYLCRRRLQAALAEPGLFVTAQQAELSSLALWADQTGDGSREDLPFLPDKSLWDDVCAEAEQCARARCRFFGSCLFHQSRRRAAHADLLVVNHSLLLADLALRQVNGSPHATGVLPPFSRLILDEAHHLEDEATRCFSTWVTRFEFGRTLNRLSPPRKPQHGLLARLANLLGNCLDPSQDKLFRTLHSQIEEVLLRCRDLRERSISDLEESGRLCSLLVGEEIRAGEELRQRLLPAMTEHPRWGELCSKVRGLAEATTGCAGALQQLLKRLRSLPDEVADRVQSLATDLAGCAVRLENLAMQTRAVTANDPSVCAWFEVGFGRVGFTDGLIVRLCTAPLEVAALLRATLFDRLQTVVLTSATLTVAGRFDYLQRRIGLEAVAPARLDRLQLASPFDHARQMLLAVPDDLPEPGRAGFAEAVRDLCEQAVLLAGGRSFVLFTAYSLLRRVHGELAPVLQARGLQVLRQGEAARHQLLQTFSQTPGCVLFATDSFWEGVDVPGRALEQVVIVRLPFKVPSEPILQARAEAITAAGGDPFRELTVPQAVIRFRQGFGRLIRRRSDRGVVLILDVRVVTKGYGRTFLRSLPEMPVLTLPAKELLERLRDFWEESGE
ncbi:MAG: helicase C-terminal domain-containing protein [Desulfuromonadales bacterium]|nr:helicase C-terminal domain-containing protein [Desulfuromonadales bacterium]